MKLQVQVRSGSASTGSGQLSLTWQLQVRSGSNIFKLFGHSRVDVTVNHCKSVFTFSTVLVAVIKCKQYSGIAVESATQVKSVKITLHIFAVRIC